MISISLSPNTEASDVWIALKTLLAPWIWKSRKSVDQVETWFKKKYKTDWVYSFTSGRTSLYSILKAFKIAQGDEVIVQAFTCIAVPEVVVWVGAKPIYADIDDSYNIDPKDIESKITNKTKAIIVQHTFGIPADIKRIKKIAGKHKLILIEDCAHGLGANVDGKPVGSFGDACLFSFGRDKVVSSVFGGVAIINQHSTFNTQHSNSEMKKFYESLSYPSHFWILQQLLHPIIVHLFVLPFYNILYIGKIILIIFQKLSLLSFPVQKSELQAKMPNDFLKKYPNALGKLALSQLGKLEQRNSKRRKIARQYFTAYKGYSLIKTVFIKEAIYLRYPVQVDNQDELLQKARSNGILLGNWYHNVIDPRGSKLSVVGYRKGLCPNAERLAKSVVNLPTYPRMSKEDIKHVINVLLEK